MKNRTRMTANRRLEELITFINICFAAIDETDMKEVANRTGLSTWTLYRLQGHYPNQPVTLATRFGTIQALGYAAGLKLEFTETRAVMSLV